jgi:calcineurin-like phosphoesterase family protein
MNQSHRGAWQLHGHSHGSLTPDAWSRRADVGVDCWSYMPVSFEELQKHMATKRFRPVDHHGRSEDD